MSLTRAQVESQLCGLFGRLMTLVGHYGATTDGTNPSLAAPMRDAYTRMGYTLADPLGLTIADADFAVLAPASLRRFFEWCELFELEVIERDWWRADQSRPPGLMPTMVGGVYRDPLASIKNMIVSRIAKLREIVMTPYQGMNVQISVGQIVAGSSLDRTIPPAMADLIAPWRLLPDGLWYYGHHASAFWGWGDWGCSP